MTDKVQQVEARASVLGAIADEEPERFELLKTEASRLASSDERINLIMSVMILAPQIYQLTRVALQQEMEGRGKKWEDGLEEFLIEACRSNAATTPISRETTLRSASSVLLKFLAEELSKETAESHAEAHEEARRSDEERRRSKIVLASGEFDRGDSVAVVGECKAVLARLQEELRLVEESWSFRDHEPGRVLTTLHLSEKAIPQRAVPAREAGTLHKLQLGVNQWMNIASTQNRLDDQLNKWRSLLLGGRCDVLYIEAGEHLYSNGYLGRSLVRNLADGLKAASRWAAEAGALLVVGAGKDPRCDQRDYDEEIEKLIAPHAKLIYTVEKNDENERTSDCGVHHEDQD